MNHPQWWLIALSFTLGLLLTFALMIGRVQREVPVAAAALRSPPSASPWRAIGRRWPWWTLAAVLVAGLTVAGIKTGAGPDRGGTASPEPPSPGAPPVVAAPTLAGLLLPASQLTGIVGAATLNPGPASPALIPDERRELAEADCDSAWNAGQHSVYAGTGQTGAQVQILRAGEKPVRHFVTQAVIAYPNADAAGRVVSGQFAQWSACSGRTVTATPPPPRTARLFTFGPVTNTGGILSMTQTSVDNAIWGCQRALAARSNVVIDIRACRPDTLNQAVDILNSIAAKIPR